MSGLTIAHLREGKRMFVRHLRVRGKYFNRIHGSAKVICTSIIKQLWTGKYYKTSLGHYPVFYSRDFGMMIESLLALGKRTEVKKTLSYALYWYRKNGSITTFINQSGRSVNFPNVYSPDSVAYLLRSVAILNDKQLIKEYKPFLQEEVNKFYSKAVHKITGEIKRHIHFGSMRDHSKRDSSCYDTVMAAVVSREAELLGLNNPLARFDYKKILLDYYWTGEYFRDNRSSMKISADANIYPFWLGIIQDLTLQKKAISAMQFRHLDKPFPIKYVASKRDSGKTIGINLFASGWQTDAIWPMSGLPFIDLVSDFDIDKAKQYMHQYKKRIERYGTFVEVYANDGIPYMSPFYSADEGMIWAALWLVLDKTL